MTWLDTHAGAVQAFASVATLAVTFALALLTARYVRLTRSIATATNDQVRLLQETSLVARRQAAVSLSALSRRLRVPLQDLAAKPLEHGQLADYAHLTQDDIADLEKLARPVSTPAVEYAAKAAYSLRQLEGLMRRVRDISRSKGWIPTEAERVTWQEATGSAPKTLALLEEECRPIAAA